MGNPLPATQARIRRRSLLAVAVVVGAGLTGCGPTQAPSLSQSPATVSPSPATTPTKSGIASPVAGYLDPTRWEGRVVTVASQGGRYQAAQEDAFFQPFAAATGALMRQEAVDVSELRRQVEAERVTWDLADFPADQALALAREGLLTPIDYQVVDRSLLAPELVLQHSVGVAFFSTVMGYLGGGTRPESWDDFWNPAILAGLRALRRSPVGNLEFALLADGVELTELYPLDVDRAFQKLDEIKPFIAQWYDNALQPVELLLNGNVTLASTFNVQAESEEVSGDVRIQWQGGMLSAQCWVIPRGAPNADLAMDLINFATRAVPVANFSQLLPFGPVNREALTLIRPDRLAVLPTAPEHRSKQFIQNWNWWLDNEQALVERFERWLLAEDAATPT